MVLDVVRSAKAIMFPDVEASRIAAATIVPHDPPAVGNSTAALFEAVVGAVPDTEKFTL